MTFYPTRDQQTKCKSCGENGLNGDLLITYDVERRNPKGDVMVHFFSCNAKNPECTYFSVLRYQMAISSTTLHPLMVHVFPKMWCLSLTGVVLCTAEK